jgi:asparagine synthase (glutamine-hydrolysing)
MCGISGEIRTDGRPADPTAVARMTARLESRGPDGVGLWSSGPVALGHRRLAIIDLSRRGDQPMVDAELGLTVVFNGCIYNHRELRRELEHAGYHFFSTSDTEVLLKAYHRWGDGFVDHLVGMFALCIVERDSGRVVLARDRLGVKPLYIAETPRGVRFASTLPALVAGGDVDTTIDPIALHHYLTLHSIVPAPRTILRGVQKVPPATVMTIAPNEPREEREYWRPRFEANAEQRGYDHGDWLEAVSDALRVAVRRRLVADVPVGVLLSGGLDSSLIVALLRESNQDALSTFSIGFETIGDEEGDEFRYSDAVAARYETDHHRFRVPTGDVLTTLPGAVAAMSEPMVSHDVVAFYLLSQEVARHVKVVQSGQGADEVFAGYHWYQTMTPEPVDQVDHYASVFFDRSHVDIAEVVNPEYLPDFDVTRAYVADHFARPGAPNMLARGLRIDSQVMLVDDPVKRVDNMTMAWGLEARVPFLDHELVELAAACPGPLKTAGGGKGILKDLARALLPAEVIDRPKGYFPVPPLIYLQGPYVDLLRDALSDSAAKNRALFRPDHVEHVLTHPDELTTLRYNKLWSIGLLELWLQTHGIS